jgi:23S rRNA (adenine2503-C2)-methyltransferase
MTELTNFFDLTMEDLKRRILSWGAAPYRARQIWHGIYGGLAANPELLTDLPRDLRSRLAEILSFASMEIISTIVSKDGRTRKFLIRLADNHRIEAVLMRYRRRITACISTQVGCAMGCVFCATGQMGFKRNLTAGEIIEQVILIARRLANDKDRMTNIVVMGMGEPFHNYEATMQAVNRLNDPEGFNFGARRFTISTIGLVPGIARFTQEKRQVNLAVSLHAATDELREQLIPVNKQYPLESLISTCREYIRKTHRRITFEWALIHEVNDDLKQAHALVNLIRDLKCHVNLIPMNPIHNFEGQATSQRQAETFRDFLIEHKIPCTIRMRRGIDIQAGCGQLATDENKRSLSTRFDK